jgi:hypothetical protein
MFDNAEHMLDTSQTREIDKLRPAPPRPASMVATGRGPEVQINEFDVKFSVRRAAEY